MAIGAMREALETLCASRGFAGLASVLVVAFVLCLLPTRGVADDREDDDRRDEGRLGRNGK